MELAYIMKDAYKNIKPMKLRKDQEDQLLLARKCHICEKLFTDPKNYEVIDHCNQTGEISRSGTFTRQFPVQQRLYQLSSITFQIMIQSTYCARLEVTGIFQANWK